MITTILIGLAVIIAAIFAIFAIDSAIRFICHCGDAGKFIFSKTFGPSRIDDDTPMKWEQRIYRNISNPVNAFLKRKLTSRH